MFKSRAEEKIHSRVVTELDYQQKIKGLPFRKKISLVFKFSRFANGKFAKFKSRLLLYYSKSLNAYMIEIQKSKLVNI